MLSDNARAKARILGHVRRWGVMVVLVRVILSEYAPPRPGCPPSLVLKCTRIEKAKATVQVSARVKAEANTLIQAREREQMEEKVMTRAHLVKDMEARAMERAHLAARARARASTAWTTRTGLERGINDGLESGPRPMQPRQQQPRRQRCSHHSLG